MYMEQGQAVQLEHILGYVSVGVAILDASSLRIRYANPYLRSLLDEPWCYQEIVGHRVDEVIPKAVHHIALPLFQHVASTGQRIHHTEVPYEGFLESRGRTYWRVTIERSPIPDGPNTENTTGRYPLLVTVEDVTDTVHSRLHLNAIHHISSAIAGPSALPLVLDRILQALQDMVGAKRCAVLLVEHSVSEIRSEGQEEQPRPTTNMSPLAIVAAQKGVHLCSQDWRPQINEHILLGRIIQEGHTLTITDTSMTPDIELPFLDDHGTPYRPGSVLCVPIFEPYPAVEDNFSLSARLRYSTTAVTLSKAHSDNVLGTIEVYHRRARGFPAEEIKLLERFAQQAGLAIQNARLFRSIDRWARTASRHAHQKENVMHAIPDSVVIFDPRWRIADANSAARKLFGWSEDIVGLPVEQAMARSKAVFPVELSEMKNVALELEHRALEGQTDEARLIGADGQHYTLRTAYTPIRDDLGDIFAFLIIYHDVTEEVAARERIEAEVITRTAELAQRNEALQVAKAAQELTSTRMELLLERLPSGVILVSAEDSTITVINCHATQLLQSIGIPLEPLDDPDTAAKNAIGANCEQLLSQINLYTNTGALIPFEERPLFSALHRGIAREAEVHTTKTDGQTIYFLVNAAPLCTADGTVTSAVIVLQEITRIKMLERAREDFFTTMAHELKTPLANIRAHLSALLAKDLQWSSEEQYDFLQTADEQVDRLVGMINHFLDASRVEAGALRLELEPILLPEMLEDLQDRLEALITSSRRQLHIDLPPQLPAVMADYELIMSVLTNLLSNAFRYAPEGDIVYLAVKPIYENRRKPPTSIEISVTDKGPGMTLEQLSALFTRFSTFAAMVRPTSERPGQPTPERRRGTARWSPATGLGLYISRGIIEAHGSKLQVQSNVGQGTTFAFHLPVVVGKQRSDSPA